MLKKRILFLGWIFLLVCLLSMPYSVMASTKKKKKATPTPTLTPVPTATEAVSMDDEARKVQEMIDALDTQNPKISDVLTAREAFDKLTMAQKFQVTNLDKLEAIEIQFRGQETPTMEPSPTNTPTPEDPSIKEGISFPFRLSSYSGDVTVEITYLDSQKPVIRIVAPSEKSYVIVQGQDSIHDEGVNVNIKRTDTGMKLDIIDGSSGTWRIESSRTAKFRLTKKTDDSSSSYKPIGEDDPIPTISPVDDDEEVQFPFVMVAMVVVLIGIYIVYMIYPKFKKTKKQQEETKKAKTQEEDEAEVASFLQYWETTKQEYKDKPVKKPTKEKPVKPALDITEYDVSDDVLSDYDPM